MVGKSFIQFKYLEVIGIHLVLNSMPEEFSDEGLGAGAPRRGGGVKFLAKQFPTIFI